MGLIKKQNTEAKSEKKRNNKTPNRKKRKKEKKVKRRKNQLHMSQFQNQDLRRIKMRMTHQSLIKLLYGLKTSLTFVGKALAAPQAIRTTTRKAGTTSPAESATPTKKLKKMKKRKEEALNSPSFKSFSMNQMKILLPAKNREKHKKV
jgi:hypothetical protein